MNTPSIFRGHPKGSAVARRRRRFPMVRYLLIAAAVFVGGCGYTGGKMLYFLGFGKGKLIEAKFQFAEGPVLIFVDDFTKRVDLPSAKSDLTDQLAQELLRHESAKKIIPYATLQRMQQSDPDFAKLSCREIGERVGAEQVLWVRVEDYLVTEDVYESSSAAHVTTTIKVIDAKEKKDRRKVRLWPASMAGFPVAASLTGSDVLRLKTLPAISKELTGKLAEDIAKLFYEHRLKEFEKEQ